MIAFVEFGAANRVTTDDEKAVTILVTAVKLVDVWCNFIGNPAIPCLR